MAHLKVVPLVSAFLSLPSWADQTPTMDQRSLTGISAYDVVVESLAPAAIKCGVSDQQLKTQAELALRKNGIPVSRVLSDTLYIRLSLLFDAQVRGCFFALELQVQEFVQRDLGQRVLATIWQKGYVASAFYQEASQRIREVLAELLDFLCNNHLAANPSPGQSNEKNPRKRPSDNPSK